MYKQGRARHAAADPVELAGLQLACMWRPQAAGCSDSTVDAMLAVTCVRISQAAGAKNRGGPRCHTITLSTHKQATPELLFQCRSAGLWKGRCMFDPGCTCRKLPAWSSSRKSSALGSAKQIMRSSKAAALEVASRLAFWLHCCYSHSWHASRFRICLAAQCFDRWCCSNF